MGWVCFRYVDIYIYIYIIYIHCILIRVSYTIYSTIYTFTTCVTSCVFYIIYLYTYMQLNQYIYIYIYCFSQFNQWLCRYYNWTVNDPTKWILPTVAGQLQETDKNCPMVSTGQRRETGGRQVDSPTMWSVLARVRGQIYVWIIFKYLHCIF